MSRPKAKRCSHALLFAQGVRSMTIWSHVQHWNVRGQTEAQEKGQHGVDSAFCLASLPPDSEKLGESVPSLGPWPPGVRDW